MFGLVIRRGSEYDAKEEERRMKHKSTGDQCKGRKANAAEFFEKAINFFMWIGPKGMCLTVYTWLGSVSSFFDCHNPQLLNNDWDLNWSGLCPRTMHKSGKLLTHLSSTKIFSKYLHVMLERAFRASSVSSNAKDNLSYWSFFWYFDLDSLVCSWVSLRIGQVVT